MWLYAFGGHQLIPKNRITSLTATATALLMLVAIVGNVGYVRTTAALNQVELERDTARTARQSEAARRVEADKARDTAQQARDEAQKARDDTQVALADVATQRASALRYLGDLYASNMVVAQEHLESGETAKLLEILDKHQPTENRPDLRGWEWHYLNSNWPLDIHSVRAHPGFVVSSVAWSPDGEFLTTVGRDGTVKLWSASTREHIRTFQGHAAAIPQIAWQPGGKQLVSVSYDGTVKLWEVATGAVVHSLGHPGAPRPECPAGRS